MQQHHRWATAPRVAQEELAHSWKGHGSSGQGLERRYRGPGPSSHSEDPTTWRLPSPFVAVLIGSNLAKDVAGRPLLRGVSFKLERRDRMALAGVNGVGKTTLLRMLAGEESVDGGELVLGKGIRVALADQRSGPGGDRLTLREYVLSGAPELVAIEAELSRLEHSMAAGAHDRGTLAR